MCLAYSICVFGSRGVILPSLVRLCELWLGVRDGIRNWLVTAA